MDDQLIRLEKETKKLEEITKLLQENISEQNRREKRLEEKIEEQTTVVRQVLEERRSYAKVVTSGKERSERPTNAKHGVNMENKRVELHSMIIASRNEKETGDQVINRIREAANVKKGGIRVDMIRKIKNGKVIIGCRDLEEKERLKQNLESENEHLEVKEVENKDPLIILKNLLNYNTEEDIKQAIRTQNRKIVEHIREEDWRMTEKYRRRARNPHEGHVILQVSPKLWQALTSAGKVHVDLQRVWVGDQSPLVQCMKCLGYGHGRKHCTEEDDLACACAYCGGTHMQEKCPKYKADEKPTCINCKRVGLERQDHGAFDVHCPVRKRWESLARSRIAYC
ncbi:uncharacterized protein LOC123690537 [Pieris rapae]|uniref:uncharacterized protein LOC123690537 n=1 Tax=Pieris rapae TaxID=64459 RepID=UPI001E27AEAB|nr:uncharacterized protein LOC123690537 [Pieris rapae]